MKKNIMVGYRLSKSLARTRSEVLNDVRVACEAPTLSDSDIIRCFWIMVKNNPQFRVMMSAEVKARVFGMIECIKQIK